jgi:general secretion pathway protein K
VVLWTVGLLSLLVASLTFDAHIEARITSYYRKRTKAAYLAQSGLEIARMLLAKRGEITGPDQVGEEDDRWFDHAKRLKENGSIDGLVESLGEGTVTLSILPEPARRNINNLDLQGNANQQEVEENLERIFTVGGITEDTELWPGLVDSFMDWIDADDLARKDGAETEDYYATLKPPYKAGNRALETVEELLLVKGYTRAILSGGTLEPAFEGAEPRQVGGIAELLTTYGDGKVNINSASRPVLMTLPGVDDLVAGAIIEEREGWLSTERRQQQTPFRNEDDLFRRIPDLNAAQVRKYITTADSQTCRITSIGQVGGVKRKIWCIGEYAGGQIKMLRWREED